MHKSVFFSLWKLFKSTGDYCSREVFFTAGFILLSLAGSINEMSDFSLSALDCGRLGPETHFFITSATDLTNLVPKSAGLFSDETKFHCWGLKKVDG